MQLTVLQDSNMLGNILVFLDGTSIARCRRCSPLWLRASELHIVHLSLANQWNTLHRPASSMPLPLVPLPAASLASSQIGGTSVEWGLVRYELGRHWEQRKMCDLEYAWYNRDRWLSPDRIECCNSTLCLHSCGATVLGYLSLCDQYQRPTPYRSCPVYCGYLMARALLLLMAITVFALHFALAPLIEMGQVRTALILVVVAASVASVALITLIAAPLIRCCYYCCPPEEHENQDRPDMDCEKWCFLPSEIYRTYVIHTTRTHLTDPHTFAQQQFPSRCLLRCAQCALSSLMTLFMFSVTASLWLFAFRASEGGITYITYTCALAPTVVSLFLWAIAKYLGLASTTSDPLKGSSFKAVSQFYIYLQSKGYPADVTVFGVPSTVYDVASQFSLMVWWTLLSLVALQMLMIGLKLDEVDSFRHTSWIIVLTPLAVLHPLAAFYAWVVDYMITYRLSCSATSFYQNLWNQVCLGGLSKGRLGTTLIVLMQTVTFHVLLVQYLNHQLPRYFSLTFIFLILYLIPLSFVLSYCCRRSRCCAQRQ
jgi:hypothetical protein